MDPRAVLRMAVGAKIIPGSDGFSSPRAGDGIDRAALARPCRFPCVVFPAIDSARRHLVNCDRDPESRDETPMNPAYLDAVEIEPEAPATHAVIWLHGLGADGHDFEPIVPHLGLDSGVPVRFVFPHAPSIPVTINAGMVMPAWYDITELELNKRHDENGIRASAARIAALIEREHERGVPASRLVLAGFSQGGAIALHVALRRPERFLGVVALSSYLVLEDTLGREATPEGLRNAFFQAHGMLDPTVPHDRGVHARDRLQALGCAVEWHEYPMFHEVCLEEIEALGKWLNACFRGEGEQRAAAEKGG